MMNIGDIIAFQGKIVGYRFEPRDITYTVELNNGELVDVDSSSLIEDEYFQNFDAWELARNIITTGRRTSFSDNDLIKIFGTSNRENILYLYSFKSAKDLIKNNEEAKKLFKKGDIIINKIHKGKALVTSIDIDDNHWWAIDKNGDYYEGDCPTDDWEKVGEEHGLLNNLSECLK